MPSLYRKWRSRSFEDLFGQEHVVRTLRNAVKHQRVAHAYLFTGPRGTGKTSTARILAKAVNCLNPDDGNPCNACTACIAADEGRAMDVIEIDAASNTSVEHVRELRERVSYAAGEGRYKIYIVDEVHRLSGAAFDAFLKTLEEPPPHVIFVFASTEPHKVPDTIASRCQRFDFRRIGPADTLYRLRFVAEQEALDVSEDALQLIAQNAHGSLRDALGLLDLVSSYGSNTLTVEDVRAALGLADSAIIIRLVDMLVADKPGAGLDEIQRFVNTGGDPVQLSRQFAEYLRALLLIRSGAQTEEAGFDPAVREAASRHAAHFSDTRIVRILHTLLSDGFSPKFNVLPQLPFEMTYIEAAVALGSDGYSGEYKVQRTEPRFPPASFKEKPSNGSLSPTPPSPVNKEQLPEPADTVSPVVQSAEAAPASPLPPSTDANVDTLWPSVVHRMGARNKSLQAVLRSSFVMGMENGELTIGFPFDFHCKMFADTQKRRVLEEVAAECVGSPVRVKCVKVTKDEIRALKGAEAVMEDDGFIDEVAERLREFHAKQL